MCFFFFFNDTATTEIYTLSLHDALPISQPPDQGKLGNRVDDELMLSGVVEIVRGEHRIANGVVAEAEEPRLLDPRVRDVEEGAQRRARAEIGSVLDSPPVQGCRICGSEVHSRLVRIEAETVRCPLQIRAEQEAAGGVVRQLREHERVVAPVGEWLVSGVPLCLRGEL